MLNVQYKYNEQQFYAQVHMNISDGSTDTDVIWTG